MRQIEQGPDDMFDQDNCEAAPLQRANEINRLGGLSRSESRHKLVEQKQPGRSRQRARQLEALPVHDSESVRSAIRSSIQADRTQKLLGFVARSGAGQPLSSVT